MAALSCPRCGAELGDPALCERCGWASRSAGHGPRLLAPPPGCSWVGRYGPCALLATIWLEPYNNRDDKTGDHVRPGFCGWHYETTLMPRMATAYEEFERWHAHRRARYCSQYSHHTTAYLWDALDDKVRPLEQRAVIQPCRQGDCWVWDTLEKEGFALPYLPPMPPANLGPLLGRLIRRMTV